MKRLIYTICAFAFASFTSNTKACGWDYDEEDYYSPWFFPESYSADYSFFDDVEKWKGNVDQWSKYLGLSYDETRYLVLDSKKHDIEAAINGYSTDEKLNFLTKDFVAKQRKALQYLVCAKTIEPYASTKTNGGYYDAEYFAWQYYDYEPSVEELDYTDILTMLQECCESETDEELKLRYAYQLVRFAHYSGYYSDAMTYFNKYVANINNKSELYYYALSQKAGAEYHYGKRAEAVKDFVNVFCHSVDLKETAYRSIFKFCSDNFTMNSLLQNATTNEEKCDVYLMLSYSSFTNPLEIAKKIAEINPNAPQLRKVIFQEIQNLETHFQSSSNSSVIKLEAKNKFKFPSSDDSYYKPTIDFISQILPKVSGNDDFWNTALCLAYFFNADYDNAKKIITKHSSISSDLKMCVDICSVEKMTPQAEKLIYDKYEGFFAEYSVHPCFGLVLNTLANRYYLNKEYAKSFLMTNSLYALEEFIPIHLFDEIREFVNKKDKSSIEKWIVANMDEKEFDEIDKIEEKAAIAIGNIDLAYSLNQKYNIDDNEDVVMFGHNIGHCFGTYNLKTDYISGCISGSEVSVAQTLYKLKSLSEDTTNIAMATKATYLLGNFFYNISCQGPLRNYLKGYEYASDYYSVYDMDYSNSPFVYTFDENATEQYQIINSYYNEAYHNTVEIASAYYDRALAMMSSPDDELKAHIIFGQAKCEKAKNEIKGGYYFSEYISPVFENILDLKHTAYYDELIHQCSYFEIFTL